MWSCEVFRKFEVSVIELRYFYLWLKSKFKSLVGKEWGRQCTANESALKSKNNHTVWNCVGDKAEKTAIAKLQRDAQNHLPKNQYIILNL